MTVKTQDMIYCDSQINHSKVKSICFLQIKILSNSIAPLLYDAVMTAEEMCHLY